MLHDVARVNRVAGKMTDGIRRRVAGHVQPDVPELMRHHGLFLAVPIARARHVEKDDGDGPDTGMEIRVHGMRLNEESDERFAREQFRQGRTERGVLRQLQFIPGSIDEHAGDYNSGLARSLYLRFPLSQTRSERNATGRLSEGGSAKKNRKKGNDLQHHLEWSHVINRREFVLGGACAAASACGKRGARGFSGYAFVANEDGKAIAVVDMAIFSVVRHIALDAEPTAIISHPLKPFVYALTPRTGSVHEIHTETMKVTRKAQIASATMAMRIAPDNSALWLLCRESRKLVRLNLETFRADAQIALPMEPLDFDLTQSGNLCAAGFGPAGSVSLIDLDSRRVARPLHIGSSIGTVRFRQDGKALLIANTAERMLCVLETPSGNVVANLPLAVRPDNLCFNQDGGQLFITGDGMDAVVVVYPYRIPEIAETVLVGRAPGVMCASQQLLFIANPLTGDVGIFDIKTRRLIAVTAVGAEPSYIVVTPGDEFALVLNRKSGDIAVIRLGAIKSDRKKSAALFTIIPVGSKPVSAVVRSA